MSTRVTRDELRQLNDKCLKRYCSEHAHRCDLIDKIMPALCDALDVVLRECGEKNLKSCMLSLSNELEILQDGEQVSDVDHADDSVENIFNALCSEIDYLTKALEQEYDTFVYVGHNIVFPKVVSMIFSWDADTDESSAKRARIE